MVELGLVLARTSLAFVLGTAGLAKLADRAGSRQAMADFGIPTKLARSLGVALPVIELIVAVALIPAATARKAGLSAGFLFVVFLGAIGYQLARGRRPDCHCFGQLHSRPIGPATLARNVVLLFLAAVVAFNPAPAWVAAAAWIRDLGRFEAFSSGIILLLLMLLLAEGWLVLNLARQQGRLFLRLDDIEARLNGSVVNLHNEPPVTERGLAVGISAPDFDLPTLDGGNLSLAQLRGTGKPVLLVSIDPGCGPCTSLIPEVALWQRVHAEALTVAVLTRGSAEVNRRKLGAHQISAVLLQRDHEVTEQYHAVPTPSAILVDPQGRIAAPLAAGPAEIRRLVQRALQRQPSRSQGLPLGSPAPAIALPDLDGVIFDLQARAGQATVLVFWNPTCGFCQRMLPALQSWELERPQDTGLVLVSSGTAEVNRQMGLRSQVVLDESFTTARSYGASGTPSGILVDTSGRIGSPLRVGAPALMTLLAELAIPVGSPS